MYRSDVLLLKGFMMMFVGSVLIIFSFSLGYFLVKKMAAMLEEKYNIYLSERMINILFFCVVISFLIITRDLMDRLLDDDSRDLLGFFFRIYR